MGAGTLQSMEHAWRVNSSRIRTPSADLVSVALFSILHDLSLVFSLGMLAKLGPRPCSSRQPSLKADSRSNPSRPSSCCSIHVTILNLLSLLCGIDLPVSNFLHPGHPAMAPCARMWALVTYMLLAVKSGAAEVPVLVRAHLLQVQRTSPRGRRFVYESLRHLERGSMVFLECAGPALVALVSIPHGPPHFAPCSPRSSVCTPCCVALICHVSSPPPGSL